MKAREAIKILHPDTVAEALKEIKPSDGIDGITARLKAIYEARLLGCEALEKQVPKKPAVLKTEEKTRYLCGCGKSLFVEYAGGGCFGTKSDFCDKCGQRLDWSE